MTWTSEHHILLAYLNTYIRIYIYIHVWYICSDWPLFSWAQFLLLGLCSVFGTLPFQCRHNCIIAKACGQGVATHSPSVPWWSLKWSAMFKVEFILQVLMPTLDETWRIFKHADHGLEHGHVFFLPRRCRRCETIPICSMYGIFTYIYPKNHPNVGKYTIHRASGIGSLSLANLTIHFDPDWLRFTGWPGSAAKWLISCHTWYRWPTRVERALGLALRFMLMDIEDRYGGFRSHGKFQIIHWWIFHDIFQSHGATPS